MTMQVVFQIAAVGILVTILNQALKAAGREEQALLVTLAGLLVVMFWVIRHVADLFETVQELFNL